MRRGRGCLLVLAALFVLGSLFFHLRDKRLHRRSEEGGGLDQPLEVQRTLSQLQETGDYGLPFFASGDPAPRPPYLSLPRVNPSGAPTVAPAKDPARPPSFLTIWTILRELEHPALDGEHKTQSSWLEALHTYNAIKSWTYVDDIDILLFGNKATCAFALSIAPNATCLPIPCLDKEFRLPRYDCLFSRAAQNAKTELLMYSNSDMVYFSDVVQAARKIEGSHKDFLMVGSRTDLAYPRMIEFSDQDWSSKFRAFAHSNGKPHGRSGIDYFCYRTKLARNLPPFLVGRVRWDNWMIAEYLRDKSALVIDTSKVVLAVHLNHMKVGNSHFRTGTAYNVRLTREFSEQNVDPKKVGNLDSADYMLEPEGKVPASSPASCPDCFIKRNVQPLEVMLYKHSTNKTIIISTVNSGYVDFAMNWLCSLKRVGLDNYLFHAADQSMFQTLHDMGLPVIYFISPQDQEFRKNNTASSSDLTYGSVSYQGLMNSRTEFIYQVLQKGYDILLSDVDTIFLRNPLHHMDHTLDIQGGVHKGEKITGGFIYFRATSESKKFWHRVLHEHRLIFAKIQNMTEFNIHSMTEQEILNNLLRKNVTNIRWGLIGHNVVADGMRFFINRDTQKRGEWPAVIHNNFIVGSENKRQRFQNISMWLVDDHLRCRSFPHPLPLPPQGNHSMAIKILTMDRPQSLLRLLKSLEEADFLGDQVPLTILIDFPSEEAVAENPKVMSNRRKAVLIARKLEWKHGPKRVIERPSNMGLVNQWLSSWFPISQSETCLFLEDDNVLSPHFYRWISAATKNYFHNATNFDPRMFGIMMQNQHMIPGRYPQKPVELLPEGTLFYRYQTLSTWAPLFFPHHWSEFLTWYSDRSTQPGFEPVFSNLVTNKWFLSRGKGKAVWSSWFLRFAAERGLYALYTNFPEGQSLVVNYREPGQNFKDYKGPNSEMLVNLEPYTMDFPPLNKTPLYDFHFNHITEDPSILEERAFYSDVYNVHTH